MIWLLARSVEGLARVLVVDAAQVVTRHALLVHPVGIGAEVVADRGHDIARVAQQLEVEGDVAGTAAELASHLHREKGHIQHVHLVGQDVVLEVVVEHHDGVKGHGTADQGFARIDQRRFHQKRRLVTTNVSSLNQRPPYFCSTSAVASR